MAATPDLSEFTALSVRDQRRRCKVAVAAESLDGPQREQLHAALGAHKDEITASAIQVWLKRRDLDVSIPAIGNHRRGGCTCER